MKRIITLVLALVIAAATLAVFAIPASAGDYYTFEIKWVEGAYIGNITKLAKDQIINSNSSYAYTEVFTVPKANTKMTFTAKSAASNGSCVVSHWKLDNEVWVPDFEAFNFVGNGGNGSLVEAKNEDGSITYTYITDKDGENLRFCINKTGLTEMPVVDITPTDDKSTIANFVDDDVKFEDGVVKGLDFGVGYIGTSAHSQTPNAPFFGGSSYSLSELFLVPEKGTTLTVVDDFLNGSGANLYTSGSAYVFSAWKKDANGNFIIIPEQSAAGGATGLAFYTESAATTPEAKTYTYTTQEDNVYIAISIRTEATIAAPLAAAPVVTFTAPDPYTGDGEIVMIAIVCALAAALAAGCWIALRKRSFN